MLNLVSLPTTGGFPIYINREKIEAIHPYEDDNDTIVPHKCVIRMTASTGGYVVTLSVSEVLALLTNH